MRGTANESEFLGDQQTENLRRAMGYKRDAVTRVGGILNPQKMKLSAGDVIFRFGNKNRSPADDLCGVWWMTQATLMLNAAHCVTVEGLIERLRQNLALPPAFSPLDRVFGASVKQRLSVFAGVGSGIFREDLDNDFRIGSPPLLLGGMERDGSARATSLAFQLFIPGLSVCGRDALDYGPLRTAIEWFNRPPGQRQLP